MKCKHPNTKQVGPDYAYQGSVAVYPYTDENRAAHGNITYTEECVTCGAQRSVNQNQLFYEYSPWGPDKAQRDEEERQARLRAEEAKRQAEDDALAQHRASVLKVTNDQALIEVDGKQQWVWLVDIEAAAAQPDTGDGLVQFYRGLRHLIAETRMRQGCGYFE